MPGKVAPTKSGAFKNALTDVRLVFFLIGAVLSGATTAFALGMQASAALTEARSLPPRVEALEAAAPATRLENIERDLDEQAVEARRRDVRLDSIVRALESIDRIECLVEALYEGRPAPVRCVGG